MIKLSECVKTEAQALFNLLEVLKNISGLVIKTEGMWIGSSRDKTSKPFGIKWPDEPIKALGVYYSYDIKLLHEKNFIERLDSVKKLINIWSSRGLSIYGIFSQVCFFTFPVLADLLNIVKDSSRNVCQFDVFIKRAIKFCLCSPFPSRENRS